MGRPALKPGEFGKISVKEIRQGVFEARARYKDYAGRIRHASYISTTAPKARAGLQAKLVELVAQVVTGNLSRSSKIKDGAQKWIEAIELDTASGELEPGSKRNYLGYARNHIIPALGELPWCELTVGRVDDFLRTKRAAGMKPDAMSSLRRILSLLCGYAVTHGALDHNPVRSVKRAAKRKPDEKKEIRTLSKEQREDLLSKLREFAEQRSTDSHGRKLGRRAQVWHDLPDLALAMLSTAGRIGEALAVAKKDLDPITTRSVNLTHHLVWESGKGVVRKYGRKGGEPPLLLGLPEWSLDMWRRRWLEASADDAPIFPGWDGSWRDPNGVVKRVSQAFEACGYGWITSHAVRHTIVEVLDNAGLSLTEIADQLGNTPEVVNKHYRPRRKINPRAVTAMEGVINKPRGDQLESAG